MIAVHAEFRNVRDALQFSQRKVIEVSECANQFDCVLIEDRFDLFSRRSIGYSKDFHTLDREYGRDSNRSEKTDQVGSGWG